MFVHTHELLNSRTYPDEDKANSKWLHKPKLPRAKRGHRTPRCLTQTALRCPAPRHSPSRSQQAQCSWEAPVCVCVHPKHQAQEQLPAGGILCLFGALRTELGNLRASSKGKKMPPLSPLGDPTPSNCQLPQKPDGGPVNVQ